MKKKLTTLCALAAALICAFSLFACGEKAQPISYSGAVLAAGKVGESYSASVATATGPDKIYYELKDGEWLPEGLDCNEKGEIFGTPTEAVQDYKFTMVAYADAETPDVEATFTITIEAGKINAEGRELKEGKAYEMYGDTLFDLSERNVKLTYALKTGSVLPRGLKVTEDGYLIGTPVESADGKAFTVTVSGDGFADSDVEYKISVAAGEKPAVSDKISYSGSQLPDATVGELYFGSAATAEGAEAINYKRTYIGGIGFPAGLKFDECGLVYGIPSDSANGADSDVSFYVTAAAEGYGSVRQTFNMRVFDVRQDTAKFESEYINLTGKQGAGYSSSPSGKGLVQPFADASGGACVGYLLTEISLDFVIYADAAVTGASLNICLASEIGDVTFTPDAFEISVNGTLIDYGSLYVTGGQQKKGDFQLKKVTDSLNLNEGRNVITLTVKANALRGGEVGGPIVDYIELSDIQASTWWRPKASNFKAVA